MLSKEHKYTCKVGLISDVIFNLVQSSKKWTKSLPSTFQSRIKSVGTIIRTISLRNTKPNWKYRLKLSHLYISQVAKSKPYAWKLKNSTHIMVHKKVWRYVSWESIMYLQKLLQLDIDRLDRMWRACLSNLTLMETFKLIRVQTKLTKTDCLQLTK